MTVQPLSSPFRTHSADRLDPRKFRDLLTTAEGSPRAAVTLERLETLWFNTGTLCNITCANCYIESSPRNDSLAYLSAAEVECFLDEAKALELGLRQVGFTGGEPFMNPEIIEMAQLALARGHEVLILTNAMRPMRRWETALIALKAKHGPALTLRVSLDHYLPEIHESERGVGTWATASDGLNWLGRQGFSIAVAGRRLPAESEAAARAGYRRLFQAWRVPIDADDPTRLVLFPEMDSNVDVPEITEACWGVLGKSPQSMMCATSRMVVKRKGAAHPVVVACTLTPYAPDFELGESLADANRPVHLNHPHCARFCVLGGASCSRAHA